MVNTVYRHITVCSGFGVPLYSVYFQNSGCRVHCILPQQWLCCTMYTSTIVAVLYTAYLHNSGYGVQCIPPQYWLFCTQLTSTIIFEVSTAVPQVQTATVAKAGARATENQGKMCVARAMGNFYMCNSAALRARNSCQFFLQIRSISVMYSIPTTFAYCSQFYYVFGDAATLKRQDHQILAIFKMIYSKRTWFCEPALIFKTFFMLCYCPVIEF